MKICNVVTKLSYGGAQETVLHSATALRDKHEVVVVAGLDETDAPNLVADFEAAGIRIHWVKSLRRAVSLHDIKCIFELRRFLREEQFDVVHTHSSKAGVIGRIAAYTLGIPVVHTVHGWSFHQHMRPLFANLAVLLERMLARITNTLIVVTDVDRRIGLRRHIGHADQYQLVRSAIELNDFNSLHGDDLRKECGISADSLVVGFVGRLARQKDPLTFVDTVRLLDPAIKSVMVATGPMQAEVEARSLEIADRVMLLGARRSIATEMNAFDVFVLSSLWEGLPRVVIEAIASGVPVVATDVGGVSEVVEDEVTGLLVPPGNPSMLANAVTRMLEDKELASRCVVNAQARIQEFDVSAMAERLDVIYSEAARQ